MSEKLTDAEMKLFSLGAAMCGTHPEGARIIAKALDEITAARKRAAKAQAKRRPKP